MDSETATFNYVGNLEGHGDWVTSISTSNAKDSDDANILVTGSRDRTVMIWRLTGADDTDGTDQNKLYGFPLKSLTGHNHFVSDISLSGDNFFCLSSSWDKTVRLWDLRAGKTTRTFVGHQKEVHSVCFSSDYRQIISAGADRTYKLWNTLAECKYTNETNNHQDWISTIRYSPDKSNPYFATAGWDGRLKIWQSNFVMKYSFKAHQDNINSLAIAPNGLHVATGGRENFVKVWDLQDLKEDLRTLNTGAPVNKVCFNPSRQWIAAACENGVQVFDLNQSTDDAIAKLIVEKPKNKSNKIRADSYACTSLAWSGDGKQLFAGFTDNTIRVYDVDVTSN